LLRWPLGWVTPHNYEFGVSRLMDEYGIEAPQLVTFMCGGVASRFDSASFWAGLVRLKVYGSKNHLKNEKKTKTKKILIIN
jgi:hypothetical protein